MLFWCECFGRSLAILLTMAILFGLGIGFGTGLDMTNEASSISVAVGAVVAMLSGLWAVFSLVFVSLQVFWFKDRLINYFKGR